MAWEIPRREGKPSPPRRAYVWEALSGDGIFDARVERPFGGGRAGLMTLATRLDAARRSEIPMDQAAFAGSEGEVFYRVWTPPGAPRRIVMIVHGYAEHGGRYTHVAETLAARGAVVCAPDHIGHGKSEGERALIVDFEHVVDDVHTLVGIMWGEYPGLPVVMVGHSMGGLLTGRYAERYPEKLAGVAFLGAVLGDWHWARSVLEKGIPDESSDPAGMSRDPDTVRAYADDPLVYRGSYKRPLLEAEVAALDRFNAELDRITMPVLFLHGAADPFVPYRTSLAAVKMMPTKDLTARVYAEARHELVNELNRDEVITALATFVERVATRE
ncbi:MAG: alpha/beta hydrolase [Acidimicrobiia bacterium]